MTEGLMTADFDWDDIETDIEPPQVDKIALYREGGVVARENGNMEEAEEYFYKALEEVKGYKSNIRERKDEIQDEGPEYRKLEEIESDLDQIEENLMREIRLL